MGILQIILLVIFLLALGKTIERYRSGVLSGRYLFGWAVFWCVGVVVMIWPDTTFYFARRLGIGRGADLVVYSALVLLFFLVFRLVISLEKQKKEITELSRVLAIREKNSKN